MAGRIPGISRTALWAAWKAIRKTLRTASVRDVIDFLEYDIDPDVWINRMIFQLRAGTYEPSTPRRFTLAKSKGFSRTMTFPEIPDLVLYRAIVDQCYRRARRKEHQHVYFERQALSKLRQQTQGDGDYGASTSTRFAAWKHFEQYRKHLVFDKTYPYIVTTDITNFFDSILYNRISDALQGISVPRQVTGLLFFLLERLSIRDAYSESPRIGLPVDEFDCSRKLAHLLLFPHDDRMVERVGEDAYVRWMDDQNIGVKLRAEGLRMLAEIGRSLGRLHLTPNSEKSRILSLNEAVRHFHLDINKMLDKADKLPVNNDIQIRRFRAEVKQIWARAKKYENSGEWSKILNRIYRLAGLGGMRILRRRASRDLLQYPGLTRRIADYIRCTGSASEYLRFAKAVWSHPEQIYPDVNLILTEGLLRLEPTKLEARIICRIASELFNRNNTLVGREDCAAVAPLLLLRYAERRALSILLPILEHRQDHLTPAIVRAAAVVYLSHGIDEFNTVRRVAGTFLRNNLAEMVRLVQRILEYEDVPGSYKARLNLRFDAVAGWEYIDMRSLLAGRLLALNQKEAVQRWLQHRTTELLKTSISLYDKSLINRLLLLKSGNKAA